MASLYFGHQEVSLGVVLGSNVFNLAGLLGLSATVARRIEVGRQGLQHVRYWGKADVAQVPS
jgi:Ca2+/Na+ antiporter